MRKQGSPNAAEAAKLADLFCRNMERRIRGNFAGFSHNDDDFKTKISRDILDGKQKWFEAGLTQDAEAEKLETVSH